MSVTALRVAAYNVLAQRFSGTWNSRRATVANRLRNVLPAPAGESKASVYLLTECYATEADYLAVSRLGSPFKIHANDVSPFRVEVAKRLAALNLLEGAPARSAVAADERARIRTEVGREFFRAEFGREPLDERELADGGFGISERIDVR